MPAAASRGEPFAGDLVPAHVEVVGDVGDGRAFDPRADVVPADGGARGMVTGVEAVAGFGCQVDAADEGDAVVDHDRLLVVAMQRPFVRVERALDLGAADELLAYLPHVAA